MDDIITILTSRVHADKLRVALFNECGGIDAEVISGRIIQDTTFEYLVKFSPKQKLIKSRRMDAITFAMGFKAGIKYL